MALLVKHVEVGDIIQTIEQNIVPIGIRFKVLSKTSTSIEVEILDDFITLDDGIYHKTNTLYLTEFDTLLYCNKVIIKTITNNKSRFELLID